MFGKNSVNLIGCMDSKHHRLHTKDPINHVDDWQCLDQESRVNIYSLASLFIIIMVFVLHYIKVHSCVGIYHATIITKNLMIQF